MFEISVRGDFKKMIKHLNNLQRKHIPFATSLALNETAKKVKEAEVAEMRRVFRNPSRFTLNAMFIRRASKTRLVAVVELKGGQAHYLHPQIHGGPRRAKRLEYHLRQAGLLGAGEFVVPGRGARITRGTRTQILSQLQAHPDRASRSTSSSRSRRNTRKKPMFFARSGHLARGVWERHGSGVRPVLIATAPPTYRKRWAFYQVGARVAARVFPAEFDKALKRALRTAK